MDSVQRRTFFVAVAVVGVGALGVGLLVWQAGKTDGGKGGGVPGSPGQAPPAAAKGGTVENRFGKLVQVDCFDPEGKLLGTLDVPNGAAVAFPRKSARLVLRADGASVRVQADSRAVIDTDGLYPIFHAD